MISYNWAIDKAEEEEMTARNWHDLWLTTLFLGLLLTSASLAGIIRLLDKVREKK